MMYESPGIWGYNVLADSKNAKTLTVASLTLFFVPLDKETILMKDIILDTTCNSRLAVLLELILDPFNLPCT